MHIGFHAIINLTAGLLLNLTLPLEFPIYGVWLIVLSGILIDLDHLFYYGFNLKKLKQDFKKKNPHFYPLHTIEFVLILCCLAFLSKYMLFVLIGVLMHFIADILTCLYYKNYEWIRYRSFVYLLYKKELRLTLK